MFKKKLLESYLSDEKNKNKNLEAKNKKGDTSLVFDGKEWVESKIQHTDSDEEPDENEVDGKR